MERLSNSLVPQWPVSGTGLASPGTSGGADNSPAMAPGVTTAGMVKAPSQETLARLHYDQPPQQRSAAARYQQILQFEQRERVAELFKVDLYA